MADLTAQLAAGMAVAIAADEASMLDTCTATRPADRPQTPPLDPETGRRLPATAPEVYAGRCSLANPASGARAGATTTNDDADVPNTRVLKLPLAAVALRPGDLVRLTASAFEPGLVGDTFLVLGEVERSTGSHRRYQVRGSSWLSPASPTSQAPGS